MKRLRIRDPWAKTLTPSPRYLAADAGKPPFVGFALSGRSIHDQVMLKFDNAEYVLKRGEILPLAASEVEVVPLRPDHLFSTDLTILEGLMAADATAASYKRIGVADVAPGVSLPRAVPIELYAFETECEMRSAVIAEHPWTCTEAVTAWDTTLRLRYLIPFAGRRELNYFLQVTAAQNMDTTLVLEGWRQKMSTANARDYDIATPLSGGAAQQVSGVLSPPERYDAIAIYGALVAGAPTTNVELYAEAA
jgi:hypothetical protein